MLQRYEFDNRTSGGVLEFASFDEGQAHHRKRRVHGGNHKLLQHRFSKFFVFLINIKE